MTEKTAVQHLLEPFQFKEGGKAILAAVRMPKTNRSELYYSLEELKSLCTTLGMQVADIVIQNRSRPHPRTYMGPGKIREIAERMQKENIDYLVFDCELTPAQQYHIEQEVGKPVFDRSDIILHIFERHARTAQAKLQVELARLQHMLPRLKRMWTHLERQRGGIGIRAGAGEKEIEKDRRIIARRIAHLRKKLKEIEQQNIIRRARRQEIVRVALVGYTNVGKTTLMNLFSHEHLRAENRLFVTLDTTVRRIVWDGIPFLLSDTVGFIKKLPHALVESFKTTLAEAREADIILHVIDIAHPDAKEQIKTVERTLKQVGVQTTEKIYVCNKGDLIASSEEELRNICPDLIRELGLDTAHPAICISAAKGWNIDLLKREILKKVAKTYKERYPHVVPRIGVNAGI